MLTTAVFRRLPSATPLLLALTLAGPGGAQSVLDEDTASAGAYQPGDILGIDDAALTPDGRWIVARDNTINTSARIYDYVTGALVTVITSGTVLGGSGVVQDAVEVTNTRAVVLGNRTMILDLVPNPPVLLVDHDTGYQPRDLAITPDESLVCIRGGFSTAGGGGLSVFELASGTLVAQAPGEPSQYFEPLYSYDVDSVVASDAHAAFTSLVGTAAAPRTRVTVMELRPAGGGAPQVVFETDAASDQAGAPHDIALFPDGSHAAVRSELGVALYRLDGAQTTQVWSQGLFGDPGPFGEAALDSIEVAHGCVATISRWSNGGVGAQLDLFDLAGVQRFDRMAGDPHDLVLTPDGTRLFVRTSSAVHGYDLATLGAGPEIQATSVAPQLATHTGFGTGLDSIVATDDKLVTIARVNETTDVRLWDLAGADLSLAGAFTMPEKPSDVDLSPDGTLAVVCGLTYFQVFDLRTDRLLLAHDPTPIVGGWPWCEGLALDDSRLAAFGYYAGSTSVATGGWISVVDLFSAPLSYCVASANSTGVAATLDAVGSASLAANDLHLVAADLPPQVPGAFFYGSTQQQLPFGNGTLCISAASYFRPVWSGSGAVDFGVDNSNLPGPSFAVGTSWNFQFVYRDPQAGGGQFDLSAGLTVDFLP